MVPVDRPEDIGKLGLIEGAVMRAACKTSPGTEPPNSARDPDVVSFAVSVTSVPAHLSEVRAPRLQLACVSVEVGMGSSGFHVLRKRPAGASQVPTKHSGSPAAVCLA